MKIAVDTNVLVRAITGDDERQSEIAQAELSQAELAVLPVSALCELVWVLTRGYGIALREIGAAIRRMINSENVVVDRPAVEAGLAQLDAGGDFADGVIAYEGRWLGAEVFVSFDRQAATLMQERGEAVRLLG
ncbi:MAG TPA: type II toxin-antitoxin system VapC family toxin [Stellaceae bacterium]|nr:type II toxin-antitoxin system VapC family toxin [Stellaceae bacterium]